MKKININQVDLENSLFHFDYRDIDFIDKNGFPADIGPDSKNAELTPKVFFIRGAKGVLDIIDVWIIWRMNREFSNTEGWVREFLSGDYLFDEEKKEHVFKIMYEWLSERKYYLLNLVEGQDYFEDDVDEVKLSALNDKKECEKNNTIPWKYLFAREMYNTKILKAGLSMEEWNMHTISGHGIKPELITLIETENGKNDALTVVKSLYEIYGNSEEYRILNSFINYCKIIEEEHKKNM